ncbi:hypothetical protein [Winogradskyella sp. SYSU M77433]|uniref:hypothetical protein n=1 Tax=Winogradskyella sp. SYSU M77433 TaxID=3042722 RepID=UPI0024812C9E|nr:hypothetical protein [Winogradskyella sp. SYSU M77433]MDH7911363.1 hypothetical protein [Winogradskyella sp. SYSU M77433]
MDFEALLKELKSALTQLFGEKWSDLKGESKKDIEQFLNDSKDKLKRWTELLVNGDIDLDDYEWLIKSQKDLMLMQALHSAGVHKISLGHFKNKVVNTIIDVVKAVVL